MAPSPANVRAARRKIPNPLTAIDNVWKAAAGPTVTTPPPSLHPPTPTTYLAGTPSNGGARRYRKGRGRPD